MKELFTIVALLVAGGCATHEVRSDLHGSYVGFMSHYGLDLEIAQNGTYVLTWLYSDYMGSTAGSESGTWRQTRDQMSFTRMETSRPDRAPLLTGPYQIGIGELRSSRVPTIFRKRPNKAPEPTPGAVTPRATEGTSK